MTTNGWNPMTKTKNEVDLQYALKELLLKLRRYKIEVKHLAVDGDIDVDLC